MPAHASARVLHHARWRRIGAHREGVIGVLAVARQNFGPSIEERTGRHGDSRAWTIDRRVGLRRVDVWLLFCLGLGLGRRHSDGRRDHRKAQPNRTAFATHGAPHATLSDPYTTRVWVSVTANAPARRYFYMRVCQKSLYRWAGKVA